MLTIDLRCNFPRCSEAAKGDLYRMVGRCGNCGTEDILFLITAGHPKPTSIGNPATCPVCGCREAWAQRLATDDEIPVA